MYSEATVFFCTSAVDRNRRGSRGPAEVELLARIDHKVAERLPVDRRFSRYADVASGNLKTHLVPGEIWEKVLYLRATAGWLHASIGTVGVGLRGRDRHGYQSGTRNRSVRGVGNFLALRTLNRSAWNERDTIDARGLFSIA